MRKLWYLLYLLWLIAHKVHATTKADDYYVAGVVEFRPTIAGLTSEQIVSKNLQAYIDILTSDAAEDTDIVIFPESTLNEAPQQQTFVPAPEERIAPCAAPSTSDYADFLVKLSCAARQNSKYVVVNLTEKEKCSANAAKDPRPCSSNDLNIFNTNVVFDREGRVISRYRKWHVYVEPKNTTYTPEFAIFETDFGVRFGHFICFDINFYTPAQMLVEKYGVHDLIFPVMFRSELPFLTSVQLQQMWAWGNNVTLLAAGGSFPLTGSTGTGIFAGDRGALASLMVGGTGVRQLFVAKVPKHGRNFVAQSQPPTRTTARQTGLTLLIDPEITHFESQLVDMQAARTSKRLCMDGFCCDFTVETTESQRTSTNSTALSYFYRIGVFTGNRRYEKEEYSDISICALYACTDSKVSSCGTLFPAKEDVVPKRAFKRIYVTGDFEKADQLLLQPNSLDEQMYPLQPNVMQWRKTHKGRLYTASVESNTYHDNLLTFGIYANYYERSASQYKRISLLLMLSAMIFWVVSM